MNQINYQELPEQYGRLLWTIAAGILAGVGTREDVEDIIADVFFSLYERPEQFDPRRGSLKTWLEATRDQKEFMGLDPEKPAADSD